MLGPTRQEKLHWLLELTRTVQFLFLHRCHQLYTIAQRIQLSIQLSKRKTQFGYVIGVCKGYVCSVDI